MNHQPAQNIDEVLKRLERLIDEAYKERSRMGYFYILYYQVTRAVKEGIETGRFEQTELMHQLDVTFANYLFNGLSSEPLWEDVQRQSSNPKLVVLQHLLLGMNTHINFDLAQATADTIPAALVDAFEKDFLEINSILYEQVDSIQNKIAKSWWFYRVLDTILGRLDEKLVDFSMKKAREIAYENSKKLRNDKEVTTNKMRTLTQRFASLVASPGIIMTLFFIINKFAEPRSVQELMDILRHKS